MHRVGLADAGYRTFRCERARQLVETRQAEALEELPRRAVEDRAPRSLPPAALLDEAALHALCRSVSGGTIVVTLGAAGCFVSHGSVMRGDGRSAYRVAARPVRAIDTTGAGDAFVGAFVFGLASGWSETAAARLGCAIAAESVLRPGTQRSFPDNARCREIIVSVAEG